MEPVAAGVKTPDVLERLSSILAIKGQKQALAGGAAQVAGQQQSQKQRAALAAYDFSKHTDESGLPDLNGLAMDPELRAAAGDQFLDVLEKSATVRQQGLTNMRTLMALRGDQRTAFGELMNGLRGDPDVAADSDVGRQKLNQALIQYGEMHGPDAYPVLAAYAGQLKTVPKGKLADALKVVGMQAQSVAEQTAGLQGQFVDTGANLQQIGPNAAPGGPTTIAKTLAPGGQETVGVDQLGNPFVTKRSPTGKVLGATGLPGAGAPGGPAVFGPGERATIEAQANKNFENVSANRAAASMAPQQLDQINKALELSRTTATGGSFGTRRAQIESNIGALIPGFQGMDDAAKVQELEKFTERIATDASKVLGVNARTDAERESIHKQNANVGYTPKAIQAVLQYAKAQTLAMQAKGDAQETWLQSGGTVTGQHDFETRFRKAYDPRVFQLAVMTPAERAAARAKYGKEEMAEIQQSAKKLLELGVHLSAD